MWRDQPYPPKKARWGYPAFAGFVSMVGEARRRVP